MRHDALVVVTPGDEDAASGERGDHGLDGLEGEVGKALGSASLQVDALDGGCRFEAFGRGGEAAEEEVPARAERGVGVEVARDAERPYPRQSAGS